MYFLKRFYYNYITLPCYLQIYHYTIYRNYNYITYLTIPYYLLLNIAIIKLYYKTILCICSYITIVSGGNGRDALGDSSWVVCGTHFYRLMCG